MVLEAQPESVPELRSVVETWLRSSDQFSPDDSTNPIFTSILRTKSPIPLSDAMRDLPEIGNIIEQRSGYPLLNWPWQGNSCALTEDALTYTKIPQMLLEYDDLVDASVFVYSCGFRVCNLRNVEEGTTFSMCNNEEFNEVAPAGRFHKWYSTSYTSNKASRGGITATKAIMSGSEAASGSRVLFVGVRDGQIGYRHVTLDVCMAVLLSVSVDDVIQSFMSVLLSVAFMQAVHVASGGSTVGCNDEVVKKSYKLPVSTIGGQLAVMAALYARVLSDARIPRYISAPSTRYTNISVGIIRKVPDVDDNLLSNNMYWIAHLGNNGKRNQNRRRASVIIGHTNAIFIKEWTTLFTWFSLALLVTFLSTISVVVQDAEWAEKVEKLLNLLFTATVASVIGIASIQQDDNWLYDLCSGRRQVFTATDVDDEIFSDILRFLETDDEPGSYVSPEQASWVSDNNHGTTKIGRPIRLTELSNFMLSVSSKFELCVTKNGGVPRVLDLTRSGVCFVSGPISAPMDATLGPMLDSRLLVGGH